MSDFDWIKESPINPFYEWDGIIFDIKPTYEQVGHIIETLLNTRKDDIMNYGHWEEDWDYDINSILRYAEEYLDDTVLGINRVSALTYSPSRHYSKSELNRYIKFSKIKKQMFAEQNELDWIIDINPFEGMVLDRYMEINDLDSKDIVGLRVTINPKSQSEYLIDYSEANPLYVYGTIIGSYSWDYTPIDVKWDNGTQNTYDTEDLLVFPKKEIVTESTNDFDWIKDANPKEYLVNKALEFNPPITEIEELEEVLDVLTKIGFEHWFIPENIIRNGGTCGLYINDRNRIIWTEADIEDFTGETYEEHIITYSSGLATVINGREFLKYFI